jgi:hypothetical protein
MYNIFFGMSQTLTADARECQVPGGFFPACAVFDALCAKFLRVDMYDEAGKLVRSYNNI